MLSRAINNRVDDITSSVISSACVSKSKGESKGEIFLRVGDELRSRWAETCDERKIGQSQAARGLVEWWVEQEPEVQQMVVGAIPARPDLVATVLRRIMAERRKTHGGGPAFDVLIVDAKGRPVVEELPELPAHEKAPARGRKG